MASAFIWLARLAPDFEAPKNCQMFGQIVKKYSTKKIWVQDPDRPFRNLNSEPQLKRDWQILCGSETSWNRFWSSNVVKGRSGLHSNSHTSLLPRTHSFNLSNALFVSQIREFLLALTLPKTVLSPNSLIELDTSSQRYRGHIKMETTLRSQVKLKAGIANSTYTGCAIIGDSLR